MDRSSKILKYETNKIIKNLIISVIIVLVLGSSFLFEDSIFNIRELIENFAQVVSGVFSLMIIIMAGEYSSMVKAHMLAGQTRKTILTNNIIIMLISSVIYSIVSAIILYIAFKADVVQETLFSFEKLGFVKGFVNDYLLNFLLIFSGMSLIAYSFKKSAGFGIGSFVGLIILFDLLNSILTFMMPNIADGLTYIIMTIISIIGSYFILKEI